jgi:Yip1 domain
MSTLANRLFGSATLSTRSYEEVETDSNANLQAIGIVILSSLGAALGSGVTRLGDTAALLVFALATWILWVLLTLFIGTELLPGNETRADFGQILRTTGFSATPGILRALGFLPNIGWFIFVAATVWMLFTFVVAIRQALDYTSTRRALAVCILGWLIHGVLLFGFILTAF